MPSTRAVFLDVGWTMAYPRASMWEIFADLCRDAGVPATAEGCEEMVRALWRAAAEHAEERFRDGAEYSDSDAEFAAMFEQLGRVIFSQLGVDGDHAALARRFLDRFWSDANWAVFPEVHEALRALRGRGVRVGVLSNAPSNLPLFLDRLGIAPLVDFVVVSAVEGVRKPDRRIFAAALDRAGVDPEAALHVGDMYLEDIVGGRGAGLRTLLIERGARALFPSFRESEGRALAAETIVNDLEQVIERL
ncbi:HAD-IA family hydrolase [Candidatus Binatia bacterium]|nr:HAD-IA family hydrolase [Candidatus Binatia bacterium]